MYWKDPSTRNLKKTTSKNCDNKCIITFIYYLFWMSNIQYSISFFYIRDHNCYGVHVLFYIAMASMYFFTIYTRYYQNWCNEKTHSKLEILLCVCVCMRTSVWVIIFALSFSISMLNDLTVASEIENPVGPIFRSIIAVCCGLLLHLL